MTDSVTYRKWLSTYTLHQDINISLNNTNNCDLLAYVISFITISICVGRRISPKLQTTSHYAHSAVAFFIVKTFILRAYKQYKHT